MEPILTRADVLKEYSTIQLFTALGVPYEATASEIELGSTKVTIRTTVPPENIAGPTLVVEPGTMLVVLNEPNLTPYGLLKHFVRIWKAKVDSAEGDSEWIAAGEMLEELEALLPDVLKAHEVVRPMLP